ncbi:MAG: 4-alpha-glucanotransferase [Acidimicrobiia bacterium]|nr:4-alpha-glucanotransferase [Acidimicrobiia bacterium]
MSIDEGQAAQRWGIQAAYDDALGERKESPAGSVERIVASLDRGEGREAPDADAGPVFVPVGTTGLPERVSGQTLVLEDGTDLGPVHELPSDLPAGLHALHDEDGPTLLAIHPPTCWRPDGLRAWGWALQLHSDRSEASWGHGDLADAATIGAWSSRQGGHPLLLLSPLHAPNLANSISASPYFASSRCFWNPLYLRIADVPGASTTDLADLDEAGRARNDERVIDRDAVWALKREALERIWSTGDDASRTAAADPVLDAFAAFTTALELHGERWSEWPADLRHPDGAGWSAFVAGNADRIAFHRWVQRLVGDQLAAAQSVVPLVHDLAIGTDPSGFDAWYWQDLFVLDGTRIGAPPDQFNTIGQDWALPPIDPWRLRAAGYEPFIRMLRAALSHGSGLRVDHVMGLFRLFWIPPDESPAEGVYVRQPAQELLALLALESQRAQAFVVGEDLGTVEPGVRETLGEHHVLSYRVMALDDTPAEQYPVEALASFTTHDLPTCAGFWTGSDLADQDRLGMEPNVADTEQARQRLASQIGVDESAPVPEVARRAYAALSRAPSRIVVAQLEDAAGVAERPNMPGTTDEWPNWSLALPEPIEAVLARPETGEISHLLAQPDDRLVR